MEYLPEEYLAPMKGRPLDVSLFARLLWRNGAGAEPDCDEFYCANQDFLLDGPLCDAAGITERLKDYWYTRGVNCHIYLWLRGGLLQNAGVFKFREDCWALRADVTELTPTKQELRVARRMIQYFINNSEK